MKAISLHQPWATLLATGHKRVETRSWKPPAGFAIPQTLAVHAAKRWTGEQTELCRQEPFRSALQALGCDFGACNEDAGLWLHFGVLLGTVDVIDYMPTEQFVPVDDLEPWYDFRLPGGRSAVEVSRKEHAFGDYSPGRWAWITRNAVALAAPVPCRGRQGLFTVEDPLLEAGS